jgi:hypothetical protein
MRGKVHKNALKRCSLWEAIQLLRIFFKKRNEPRVSQGDMENIDLNFPKRKASCGTGRLRPPV